MRNSLTSGTKILAFVAAVALVASASLVTFAAPNNGSGSGQTPECKAKIDSRKSACIKRYRGNPNLITACRDSCASKCTATTSRPVVP